jgi:hypothetical protein
LKTWSGRPLLGSNAATACPAYTKDSIPVPKSRRNIGSSPKPFGFGLLFDASAGENVAREGFFFEADV